MPSGNPETPKSSLEVPSGNPETPKSSSPLIFEVLEVDPSTSTVGVLSDVETLGGGDPMEDAYDEEETLMNVSVMMTI